MDRTGRLLDSALIHKPRLLTKLAESSESLIFLSARVSHELAFRDSEDGRATGKLGAALALEARAGSSFD